MAASSFTARIPAGAGGMTARRNRTLVKPEECIIAENVTFEGDMVSRMPGATTLYSATIVSANITFASTLSASDGWAAMSYLFPSAGGNVWNTSVNTDTASTTAGTSLTITLTSDHSATDDMDGRNTSVLFVARTYGVDITSVVDSSGRVWHAVGGQGFTPNSTYALQLYMADQESRFPDLLIGGTVTITFDETCAALATLNECGGIRVGMAHDDVNTDTGTAVTGYFDSVHSDNLAVVAILTDTVGVLSTTPTNWTERIEITPATGRPGLHVYTRITTIGEACIACTEFDPRSSSTITGNVAVTAGNGAITGSGSSVFLTELRLGDEILINSTGERRVIATVSSNGSAAATVPFNVTASAASGRTVWQRQRLVWAAESGNLYKSYRGATAPAPVTLSSTLSAGARTGKFLDCGMEATGSAAKLFYFNGTDTVRELTSDGATASAIANPSTDWATGDTPSNGVVHQGRVFAFGTRSNPFTMYASSPTDHEDFTTANTATRRYQIDSSVGQRIVCAASFQGLLYIWKYPRGMFYLDDSDLTSANWNIQTMSRALGCANSPHAVLQMDDDIMFLDATGQFHLMSAVSNLGGVKDSNLSDFLGIADWLRSNVNIAELETICSFWDPDLKIAHWGLPIGEGRRPSLILKMDFSGTAAGGAVKVSLDTRDAPLAMCGSLQPVSGHFHPLIAEAGNMFTSTGFRAAGGDRTLKDGLSSAAYMGYTAVHQTAYTDFSWLDPSLEFKRKIFDALEIEFEPIANTDEQTGDVSVQVWVDNTLRQTLAFTPSNRRQRRALQCGDGYTISFRIISTPTPEHIELSQVNNFQLIAYNVWFQEGAEDHSRSA